MPRIAGVPAAWLGVAALVVIADQLTKFLAQHQLMPHVPVELVSVFSLTLTYNTGAAFSFLSQAPGWQRWFFIALGLVVSAGIVAWLRHLSVTARWQGAALALVLGGALGNVWDRVQLGYVIDFIDIHYHDWHWPAFNIADSCITIGAVMLVIDALRAHNTPR